MNIAIIGSGISGLTAAYLLAQRHQVTVYEAASKLGGHVNTIDIDGDDGRQAIDTGFIVFNRRTYPNFVRLIDRLDVAWHETDMSFSVRDDRVGLEYNGGSLRGFFAQPWNMLNPQIYRLIHDIIRFNKESKAWLDAGETQVSLGEFIAQNAYGTMFKEQFILPMGAAIWSCNTGSMQQFPAAFFIRFFANHGFLEVKRPRWRVISGGSMRYVEAMTQSLKNRCRVASPVRRLVRGNDQVKVITDHDEMSFDRAVLAVHSNQALAMLEQPTELEHAILGAIPYQPNTAVLHTDDTVLPRTQAARASWNYHIADDASAPLCVTYDMNRLQGFRSRARYLVTLNPTQIAPEKILQTIDYAHPLFTPEAVDAQGRYDEINGQQQTHYCGAYWRYGFHEDGMTSGIRAAQSIDPEVSL